MIENITTIIASVNYDDFLDVTLPNTTSLFRNILIATSPSDYATQHIAQKFDVPYLATDSWYQNGAAFNKAVGLNHALSMVPAAEWVLTLDADILIPHNANFGVLDESCLYSAIRYVLNGNEPTIDPQCLDMPCLLGYLQLWNQKLYSCRFRSIYSTADSYDIEFGLRWPECRRRLLPFNVTHLGATNLNWSGRRTKRWQN